MTPPTDVRLLWEQPGQKHMMRCPWCEEWAPRDSFIALQTPPNHPAPQTTQVYKHGGVDGCKMVFALGPGA